MLRMYSIKEYFINGEELVSPYIKKEKLILILSLDNLLLDKFHQNLTLFLTTILQL